MRKRILSFCLQLLVLINLCACGKAEVPEPENNSELVETWISEAISLPKDVDGWYGATENYSLCDGVIYFSAQINHIPAIICYDTEDETWSRVVFDSSDLWEYAKIENVSVMGGTLWALIRNQGANHPREYSILHCDLNLGLTADRIPIPFEAELDPDSGQPIFLALHALGQNRALLADTRYAYCIDSTGQKQQTADLNGRSPRDYIRVNGELYFEGENSGKQRFDRESFRFAEEIPIAALYSCESENGHFFVNGADRELLGYDVNSKESFAMFNWMDVALDADSLYSNKLIETSSGDFYYPARNCLVKVTRTMRKPKTELKMLCFMEDEEYIPDAMQGAGQYMDAILYFNSTNPDYKIRVTTICDSKETMTKNLIQLATSSDYDLIDTGILPDGALDSSLLTDLLPYLDSDTEISRDDFIPNALGGMLRSGKLYAVTPFVQIMTWGMREDHYPGKEVWDIDYATQMIGNRGDKQVFFWSIDQDLMAKVLAKIATAEFIDFETPACRFDDGRFAQWMEFLRNIPWSDSYSESPCLYDVMFELRASTPWDEKRLLQTEDYCLCGFPGAEGNGHYFARVGQNIREFMSDPSSSVSMGIMATSQHKEAAWSFLRILLQHNNGTGIPVLSARLDELLASLVTDEKVRGYQSFTAEDAEKIRTLVYETDKTVREDQQLLELISSVIHDYLAGRYSAEEAASNLQKRASIYLAEQSG